VVKSMTGFASLTEEVETATITVSIRTVNHRFLDLQLRLPASLTPLEGLVRASVAKRLARGRVELAVSVNPRGTTTTDVELNEAFVEALERTLDRARARGLVTGSLGPGDLLRLPQALTIRERAVEVESADGAVGSAVVGAVEQALLALETMRAREGGHLLDDMARRTSWLARTLEDVATLADQGREALSRRLTERVKELSAELPVDQTLLAQEIVRFASRSDISEEVTRFKAHLSHWESLTGGPEPCGRKLDFLLQEMNREINTLGSKADGLGVAELVIATKAELERLREQVQNVE
jgi:uncharacterized protein (TIGR00255 family)